MTGKIKWFSDILKYGFIEDENGQELFFSAKANPQKNSFHKSEKVQFEIVQGKTGLQAGKIQKIDESEEI